MNPDDLFQSIQKGFRITIGATGAVLESIQNPQVREETLTKLRTNPTLLADELAAKGEVTEREARNFVDKLVAQASTSSSPGNTTTSASPTATPTAPPDIQSDLKELTQQIAEMRAELERLRQQDNQ